MKRTTQTIGLIFLSIMIYSCSKKDNEIIISEGDYFPLEIGNYWQFDNSQKNEVIGSKLIENLNYFESVYSDDTSYYRIDNNKIIVKENNDSIGLKFDLTANVNDTWNYNSWKVTLSSKKDTIKIGNIKYINCYRYCFDIHNLPDASHCIWLAPGLGFIQESCNMCLNSIKKVNKARINNQEINY